MITYFIPFYNEEKKNLKKFLPSLSKYISLKTNKKSQFILINDGSTDRTYEHIGRFIKKLSKTNRKKIRLVSNYTNKGVGYSFRKALKLCNTKYIITIPSDFDVPLIDFYKFVKKDLDLVMFYKLNMESYSKNRMLLTVMFRLIYNYFFDIRANYIQGPCLYKCSKLRKNKIYANRMSFWAETNTKMLRSKISYAEVPLIFNNISIIDRTVSLKNFIEVTYQFLRLYVDIKIFNFKKYKFRAKKVYI